MHAVKDQRTPGWFWIHNAVLDQHGARLKPIALAVYMDLARHANSDGEAWPGKRTIAREIGASERAVQYALRQLEDARLISITTRKSAAGDPTTNLYTLKEPPSFPLSSLQSDSSLNVSEARGAPPLRQELPHLEQQLPQVEQDVPLVGQDMPHPPAAEVETPETPTADNWHAAIHILTAVSAKRSGTAAILNAITPIAWTPDRVTLRTTTDYEAQWLNSKMHTRIADAVTRVAGQPIPIEIIGPAGPAAPIAPPEAQPV